MADSETFYTEITIYSTNGKYVLPRFIDCPGCGHRIRKRPGNVYGCGVCDSTTTLELPNGTRNSRRRDPKKRKQVVRPVRKEKQKRTA